MNKIHFLFLLFYLFAGIDMCLTNIALDDGFYETNEFTNSTSLIFHFVCLILIVFFITICSLVFITEGFTISFLCLLNIVWFINNVWSVILLLTH